MINLELTEEEAESLYTYLGVHSLGSEVKTYPVFQKLHDILPERDMNEWIGHLGQTSISERGLFQFKS